MNRTSKNFVLSTTRKKILEIQNILIFRFKKRNFKCIFAVYSKGRIYARAATYKRSIWLTKNLQIILNKKLI